MKQKILIISFSNLRSDPRVRRQINFLKTRYNIVAAGYNNPEIENIEFIDVHIKKNRFWILLNLPFLLLGFNKLYYWNQLFIKKGYRKLKDISADLIIANDIEALPLALKIKKINTKIIFDAHEYSPLEHDDSIIWRILFKKYNSYIIEKYAHKSDLMFTVCFGIAEKYKDVYNLSPLVVTNASEYYEIKENDFPNEKIKLIHHGMAHPSRKIENMIKIMDYVDHRFELDLMLVFTNKRYKEKIENMVKARNNINLIKPVSVEQIIPFTNKYDVGIYLLEPTNFNNGHALPNKFFEFVQARLCIAMGPSPEVGNLIKKHNLGIVSKDFTPQSLASSLNSLNKEKIMEFKKNANVAAKILNSDYNLNIIGEEVNKLLN